MASSEDLYMEVFDVSTIDTSTWHGKEEVGQKLYAEQWYHGRISRQEAQRLLTECEPGSYVVRVSEKHSGYAITLLYEQDGQRRYSHIMVMLHDNGPGNAATWLVQDQQFNSVKEAIEYYKTNQYKSLTCLKFCVKEQQEFVEDSPYGNINIDGSHVLDPDVAAEQAGLPPPVPPRSAENLPEGEGIYESGHIYAMLEDESAAPKVLSVDDADGYAVPGALLANTSVIDFASENMYLSIEQATAPVRAKSIKAPALVNANAKKWGAVEVIHFLKREDLEVFKNVLYRNGVVGKMLLKLTSAMFPPGKFDDEDIERFDLAIMKLKLAQ